jgi:hypothetical protein
VDVLGDAAIFTSHLENAFEQFVVFFDIPNPFGDSQPGLCWYKVVRGVSGTCDFLLHLDHHAHHFALSPYLQSIGQNTPVIAQASGDVDLHVHSACDLISCDITDVIYGGSSLSRTVEWTAVSGVGHL